MYRRKSLFRFSIDGFSHGAWTWQKYILIPSILSNLLCSRKRISLSNVMVCISGYRFFIRINALSTFRTDTGKMRSNRFFRVFRSRRPRMIPLPLLPDTMKSPSMWPKPHLLLILLGLLSIMRLSVMRGFKSRDRRFFLKTLDRWDSILRPYGLLMNLRIAEAEAYETPFSIRFRRSEMFSGDWSSRRCVSTNERRSVSRAIVLPTARLYFLRTYEMCCAYSASYGRPFRFFCTSYQMTFFRRPSAFPMSSSVYFFASKICISFRSLFVKCFPLVNFSFVQCIKKFEFKRLVASEYAHGWKIVVSNTTENVVRTALQRQATSYCHA